MGNILTEPAEIKASESHGESDIDATATELLGLRDFVVESDDIDEAKQETIFCCRIRADYGVCPRCRSVSGDMHQYKRRRVRDMMCFGRIIYLVFDIRRFRCPKCHKVFTKSLDSITFNQQYTFDVNGPGIPATAVDSQGKLAVSWGRIKQGR
jgi:transposase-like protein